MSHQKTNGGYAGLLLIILSIVVLGYLYLKTYLTEKPMAVIEDHGVLTTTTTTAINAYRANTNSALKVEKDLNTYNQTISAELGE